MPSRDSRGQGRGSGPQRSERPGRGRDLRGRWRPGRRERAPLRSQKRRSRGRWENPSPSGLHTRR